MSTTPAARYRRMAAACALACAVGLSSAPLASALPNGMSPQEAMAVVSAPISVPAGETVTVDLGVPVSASYSGGGWSVSSAGTAVTVTAPNTPGAQANFTASAAGQSAPITLIAEGTAAAPAAPADSASDSGSGANPAQDAGTPGTGGGDDTAGNDSGAEVPAAPGAADDGGATEPANTADTGSAADAAQQEAPAPNPDRQAASEVDTVETEYIELDAVIEGNTISAQLGLGTAAKLLRQFQDIDQESVKLRYLDVNGNVIEGVDRDVDVASRSLTLIYPEGETPDNPFVLQVVRDGAALLQVRLTDPNQPVASPSNPEAAEQVEQAEQTANEDTREAGIPIVGTVLGILALVIVVAIVAAVTLRSRRAKRSR